MQESALCVICCDRPRQLRFYPCRHAVCCYACLERLPSTECPLCKEETDGFSDVASNAATFVLSATGTGTRSGRLTEAGSGARSARCSKPGVQGTDSK